METEGIALRGLFLIDKDSIVRHITVNDLSVGRSIDEVLRLIKAFQFVEKHGEGMVAQLAFNRPMVLRWYLSVCPANWKENSPTIQPDPKGSLNYFKEVNK